MYLTLNETKHHFRVKDNRTIMNFIREGLKFIKIGKQYRFDLRDIEEFEKHLKEKHQEELIQIYPIKKKTKCKTLNIDYEKRRSNLILNKVI